MNGIRILGAVLAVALMIFVMAPIASAQTYAGILQNQWFKVSVSMKGYGIADDGETVMGKGGGSVHAYLYMSYDTNLLQYTVTTCTQDNFNDSIWHKNTAAPLSIDSIYGFTYPQVWEFDGIYLEFYNGEEDIYIYPTFYTKVTVNGSTLSNATISNVACLVYVDMASGEYGTGSCTIKGSLVSVDKVPAGCQ